MERDVRENEADIGYQSRYRISYMQAGMLQRNEEVKCVTAMSYVNMS